MVLLLLVVIAVVALFVWAWQAYGIFGVLAGFAGFAALSAMTNWWTDRSNTRALATAYEERRPSDQETATTAADSIISRATGLSRREVRRLAAAAFAAWPELNNPLIQKPPEHLKEAWVDVALVDDERGGDFDFEEVYGRLVSAVQVSVGIAGFDKVAPRDNPIRAAVLAAAMGAMMAELADRNGQDGYRHLAGPWREVVG